MARPRQLTRDQMLREMTSRWAPFPNVQSHLGAYDYFSQTVSLDSVPADRFAAAFRDREFYARLEVYPLLIHEMQHFADHVSTVWGRNLLVRLFNVYAARMSGSLDEFWRIPEMMRELKTIHYDDYYTDVTNAAVEPSDGSPWLYTFSTGFLLDSKGRRREDRPILFTQFTRRDVKPYICRVPFSVASLLEVRAMAAEMIAGFAVFESGGDDPVKMADKQQWMEKTTSIAYDPFLAEYTVAAHYFTNVLKTSEFFTTYQRAAAVAWLSLNLPGRFFEKLVVPRAFATWEQYWDAFKVREDRGFLYACLIENGRGLDTKDMDWWLGEALKRSGLPPLTELRAAVEVERAKAIDQAGASPYRLRLEDVLAAGLEYAKGEQGEKRFHYTFRGGPLPPLLLQGGKFVRPQNLLSGPTFADPGDWFDEAFRLQNRLRQFVDACIT